MHATETYPAADDQASLQLNAEVVTALRMQRQRIGNLDGIPGAVFERVSKTMGES